MTGKEALAIVGKYMPCPHDNARTDLGNGKIWARCDDCGAEFAQENWERARASAKKFEDAMDRLSQLILKGTK